MSAEHEHEQEHEHEHEDASDYEYETRVWLVRTMAVGLAAAIAVAIAFVIGILPLGDEGPDNADEGQLAVTSETAPTPASASAPATDSNATADDDADADPETETETETETESDEPAASSIATITATELVDQDADTDDATTNSDAADAGADTANPGSGSDTDANSDVGVADGDASTPADAATSPAAASDTPTGQPSYPVLPDGSPVPVLGIYDGALITLSGVVPSEEAADRLRTLALAFSKVPDADVANLMTVDPTIPLNVGVRVIEMNSTRFPEGTPRISADHALELDRVALLMTALPQVTTVVIGHADQRGDNERNFALSADRARAALDYIAAQGIDPTRLSARGSGESDLLTLNDDDAALALNRRTEFVISGLFVGPAPTVAAPSTDDPAADDPPADDTAADEATE